MIDINLQGKNMTQQQFLNLLFEPEEQTCFAADPYGITIAKQPLPEHIFFSINAMHTSRKDDNVQSYRNILLELDKVPLEQQVALVTAKLPVSAITYSGNKSYHFIISLLEPMANRTAYDRVVRALMTAIPEADPSTKNPSRLSRLPGVFRPDTGRFQELLYLGKRVSLAELPELPPERPTLSEDRVKHVSFVSAALQEAMKNPDTYIMAKFSGRNQFFYWVGKRCSELKQTKEQKKQVVDIIYDRLQDKSKFSRREAYAAARVKF